MLVALLPLCKNLLVKTMSSTKNPKWTEDGSSTMVGVDFSGFCFEDNFSNGHLPREHPIVSVEPAKYLQWGSPIFHCSFSSVSLSSGVY
jgi:hypothetical protein